MLELLNYKAITAAMANQHKIMPKYKSDLIICDIMSSK
jgi:hypothetical protein